MILPGMNLLCHTAYPRAIIPHYHEQILGNKPHVFIRLHNLDMGESLPIGTYFVLTLDNQHASVSKNSIGFSSTLNIKFKHGFVIFAPRPIARAIVAVVAFIRFLARVRSATRRVHVWRVEHHTIYVSVSVREITAVGPVCDVGRQESVSAQFYILPEHTLAVGDIRHDAALEYIEFQDFGEHILIRRLICAQNEIIFRGSVSDNPFCARSHVCVLTAKTPQDILL